MNITINRDVFAQHIQGLIEVMRMPNSEHVADAHNKAVRFLRAALAAQPSHTEAQRGEPALWRYRDSEQCIKPMDGYTPGEGWTPLYAAPQPERKPMTDDETLALFDRVKVRMLFTDAEVAPFASGVAAAEHFHGIGDKP